MNTKKQTINVQSTIFVKTLLTLALMSFWYKPEIKLDLNDSYSILGTIEKRGGRVTNYVIRVFNSPKTVSDRDVYKYAWFVNGYDGFGANNKVFCENESTLALLKYKKPVEVTFAKNLGGILTHDYMVLEVKQEGKAIECYSREQVLQTYHHIWLSNLHPISISFLLLGLLVIWFSTLSDFLKLNKDK